MGEFPQEDRVGHNLEEAACTIEFSAAHFRVEHCAGGVLHPRVRTQNPQC